jgi:hypothetical protein
MEDMLRHTVATLAYRAGKALRGAPPEFSAFRPAEGSRSAGQILAHLCDLFQWASGLAEGRHEWKVSAVGSWEADTARSFSLLEKFDRGLAVSPPAAELAGKLFQAPIADALTHVGQIAMLRRLAGCPIRGENYFTAKIEAGRAGANQAAAVVEFD